MTDSVYLDEGPGPGFEVVPYSRWCDLPLARRDVLLRTHDAVMMQDSSGVWIHPGALDEGEALLLLEPKTEGVSAEVHATVIKTGLEGE